MQHLPADGNTRCADMLFHKLYFPRTTPFFTKPSVHWHANSRTTTWWIVSIIFKMLLWLHTRWKWSTLSPPIIKTIAIMLRTYMPTLHVLIINIKVSTREAYNASSCCHPIDFAPPPNDSHGMTKKQSRLCCVKIHVIIIEIMIQQKTWNTQHMTKV